MINAFSHNDALAQLCLIILAFILTYRVTSQPSQPRHTLWFAGVLMLIPVLFLATREPAMAVNPYVSTFALLGFGVLAAGFISALDKTGKIASYYLMYILAGTIVYLFGMHYGDFHAKVLGAPAFFALAVPTLAILLWLPIQAAIQKKASFHSLWMTLGAAFLAAAGYILWGLVAQKVVIAKDWVNPVVYTVLFGGFLFLLLGFMLAKEWLAGKESQ